jgi:hypothetical protein
MKDKRIIIGLVVILFLVLGGGYYLLSSNQAAPTEEEQATIIEDTIPTLSPSEIGLTLTARSDNKAVKFAIAKPEGITSVDYEISYMAEGDIPRGAIGKVDAVTGNSEIESKFIDLGSCSSGKCKYDSGVTSVTFTLKITKSDGKVYQVQKSLSLE